MLTQVVILCAACVAIVAMLGRYSERVCTALRLMDVPNARKRHAKATPLLGGLALIVAILPLSLIAIFAAGAPQPLDARLLYVIATGAMALIGIADDRHTISATARIVLSFAVFGTVAMLQPLFNVRTLVFGLPNFELGLATTPIALLFTATCCVGLVNAVNMADGKNGLVIGLCLGWLTILSGHCHPEFLPLLALLMAGLTVLLIFNLRGRIFLGDGGSYGFAAAIGLIAIASYNAPGPYIKHMLPAELLMLLFAVPVFDSFRLTFLRIRRGQSPMTGDRDHLHHILLDRLGWPKGLIIYLLVALTPAALAFAFIGR